MADKSALQPNVSPHEESQPITVSVVKEPLKVYLQWKSPARPFKRRDREFYTTAGSIILLVCIILLFLKEFLLIMAIVAFSFFLYILNTVEPEEVEHQITSKGIFTLNKTYFWEHLGRFWFDEQWGEEILYVENYSGLPPRLMLMLGKTEKKTVNAILERYLLHERPEKSQIAKWSQWLQQKVPLESPAKSPHK